MVAYFVRNFLFLSTFNLVGLPFFDIISKLLQQIEYNQGRIQGGGRQAFAPPPLSKTL